MATHIIEEIEAGGDVYTLHGKAMVNSNNTNSTTPYIYDWVGTQAEYNTQQIETLHPEWICYITDDVQGGYSVYTKTETDAIAVHKTGNETISGTKTFNDTLKHKSSNIDSTTNPSETIYSSSLSSVDNNNIQIGYVAPAQFTDGTIANRLGVSRSINGTMQYADIQIRMDTSGNIRAQLPAETYGTNFHGTSTSAKWADLAEMYESDKTYSKGTLIQFGGKKDITIAKNNKCNGVISADPGFVLDAGKENSLPVALCGKTPIRIIGKVKRFDNITLSETPGVGRIALDGEKVIGKCLEASDVEEEKLVMCVTKFNID